MHLVAKEEPDLVFLQETNVCASFFSLNKFKLGFQNAIVFYCEGKSGGLLAILWKEDVCFEILNFSMHIIFTVESL